VIVENHTPFAHLAFERRTARDEPLAVVVVQGTYGFTADGRLQRRDPAPDVLLGNVYRESGSIRQEGVIATGKVATDVHLDAVARAPGGRPATEWSVSARVGPVYSELRVRGPHVHESRSRGWVTSDPAPASEVPIVYERAFGGTHRVDGRVLVEPRNPLGTGYLPRGAPTDRAIPGAQIVAPGDPFPLPLEGAAPRGWSPLGPDVEDRLKHAGTYDDVWLRDRWPLPPDDFDLRFYQSAHPDLRMRGFLRGDEAVELVHVSEAPVIRAALPGVRPWLLLKHTDLRYTKVTMVLDTVHLGVAAIAREEHFVTLTWRAVLREPESYVRAEARLRKVDGE
jgi:hypothetical protein